MKIIKVIVDEMPEGCWDCDFLHRVNNQWGVSNKDENGQIRYLCVAHGFKRTRFNVEKPTRPDWCPLVTVDELFEGDMLSELYRGESEVE